MALTESKVHFELTTADAEKLVLMFGVGAGLSARCGEGDFARMFLELANLICPQMGPGYEPVRVDKDGPSD